MASYIVNQLYQYISLEILWVPKKSYHFTNLFKKCLKVFCEKLYYLF